MIRSNVCVWRGEKRVGAAALLSASSAKSKKLPRVSSSCAVGCATRIRRADLSSAETLVSNPRTLRAAPVLFFKASSSASTSAPSPTAGSRIVIAPRSSSAAFSNDPLRNESRQIVGRIGRAVRLFSVDALVAAGGALNGKLRHLTLEIWLLLIVFFLARVKVRPFVPNNLLPVPESHSVNVVIIAIGHGPPASQLSTFSCGGLSPMTAGIAARGPFQSHVREHSRFVPASGYPGRAFNARAPWTMIKPAADIPGPGARMGDDVQDRAGRSCPMELCDAHHWAAGLCQSRRDGCQMGGGT